MSRRKRHAEHANHERWLVSYADFITLMFAFFVVMFSSSQVDKRKVGKLAMAMQVAFEKLGVFESSNTKLPLATTQPMPFSETQTIENTPLREAMDRLVSSPQAAVGGVPGLAGLSQLRHDIEEALAPQIKLNEVALEARHDGLVLSLREVGFFDSGSAELKSDALPAIAKLAGVLRTRPYTLRIEGHTDNVPIHSSTFASNWQLSTARATNLIEIFITGYGFKPDRLSAGGYAEFHPVAPNDTPEGRAMNRRVDIVIVSPEPSPQISQPVVPDTAAPSAR